MLLVGGEIGKMEGVGEDLLGTKGSKSDTYDEYV